MTRAAGRTILVAEDNPDDQFLFTEAFRAAGGDPANLRLVSTGEEAILYLEGWPPYDDRALNPFPALILLDIKMPRKTGLEVLEFIRGRKGLACLPVVMLSASSLSSDIERAYRLGANSFLSKPSSLDALSEAAGLIRRYWLDLNEAGPTCQA